MKQLLIGLTAFVLLPSALFAQKVGDIVIVIADNQAKLKAGGKIVGTVERGDHFQVEEVNGESFRVNFEGITGWVKRKDVIHLDNGHLGRQLEAVPA